MDFEGGRERVIITDFFPDEPLAATLITHQHISGPAISLEARFPVLQNPLSA